MGKSHLVFSVQFFKKKTNKKNPETDNTSVKSEVFLTLRLASQGGRQQPELKPRSFSVFFFFFLYFLCCRATFTSSLNLHLALLEELRRDQWPHETAEVVEGLRVSELTNVTQDVKRVACKWRSVAISCRVRSTRRSKRHCKESKKKKRERSKRADAWPEKVNSPRWYRENLRRAKTCQQVWTCSLCLINVATHLFIIAAAATPGKRTKSSKWNLLSCHLRRTLALVNS